MKLIEALKKLKDLERKLDDIIMLVKQNCALSNMDTAPYDNQTEKVRGWIQSYKDVLKEIAHLRLSIQHTNLVTIVEVVFGDTSVKKSIAYWIHRRRDLARKELAVWQVLSDRGIKEGKALSPGGTEQEIKIKRYFSPEIRDKEVDLLQSEPSTIDGKFEIANALTELVEVSK